MSDLVVSTECPTCAAALDFPAGTNAVRCGHCRSTLLVTGRKRVLSYAVAPAVDTARAVAQVKTALAGAGARGRVGDGRLFFVPYYRLTGQEFRWERPVPPGRLTLPPGAFPLERVTAPRSAPVTEDGLLATIQWAGTVLGEILGKSSPASSVAIPQSGPAPVVARRDSVSSVGEHPVFHDRYIDRSFLACQAPELGVESLGLRASVLRVTLFRQETLAAIGHVVPVDLGADTALAIGMEAVDADAIVHRTVIGRMLSIIYFPLWLVEVEDGDATRLAIVDAVAETVVRLDAPASLLSRLDRPVGNHEVVGFRALTCPNCGWDLPVRPDDVIFFCASCEQAWQLHGAEFEAVPAEVARLGPTAPEPSSETKYLPCWVFETAPGMRLFAPAFRFRRLKFLSDLARNLAQARPVWEPLSGPKPALHGCYYDVEDGALLAQFTRAGAAMTAGVVTGVGDGAGAITAGKLAWFPFTLEQRAFLDPFTRLPLPENLLV
jgi:DNA-directed RNA polymerase subunit RPC12/RpoP